MENTKLLNQLENIASKVNLEYVPELAGLINELKAEIYSESNGKIDMVAALINAMYFWQKIHADGEESYSFSIL